MSCCTVEGTEKFFSKGASSYAKKFRRHGLDRSQRLIAENLATRGLSNQTLLEIGCGVGALHLTLLKRGAAGATGVEISGRMIDKARELAAELNVAERVTYRVGDFVPMSATLPQGDAVILDKVICCYADPVELIASSSAKARVWYAVSYPRNTMLAKALFKFSGVISELLRGSFSPLYYETSMIETTIERNGFAEVYSGTTPVWQVKVYRRIGSAESGERN